MQNDIKKAVQVLQNGGLILYPTDTIWGIGCDATNPEAVKKVFSLKKRSDSKSLIILIDNINHISKYADSVPDIAYDLIEYSEKPVTIIFEKAKNLAKNLISIDESIAIRVTKDEFCSRLISKFNKPIVSTSANLSGDKYPQSFLDITPEIVEKVDYVVEWRQEEISLAQPSSILKLWNSGQIKIIRK
ncbi:MAG: threonylcarbamoyl-AMP synthase [Bacteroidetes bacterium]|nr:threonylcarbamoyl-AMP synthase [Bacteroidota bacterium]